MMNNNPWSAPPSYEATRNNDPPPKYEEIFGEAPSQTGNQQIQVQRSRNNCLLAKVVCLCVILVVFFIVGIIMIVQGTFWLFMIIVAVVIGIAIKGYVYLQPDSGIPVWIR